MDEPTSQSAAVPVMRPSFPLWGRVLIITAVALIVIVGALMVIPVGGMTAWQRIVAHVELQGLVIADRNYESTTLKRFGPFGMKEYPVEVPGTLGDYDEAGKTRVAIVGSEETGAQELWLLGKEPRVLTGSGSAKAAVAVSPDGSKVAYAARTDGGKEFENSFSDWTVHLFDLEAGTDTEIGNGFGPQFFMRDGDVWLLHTASSSVTVTNMETLQGFSTPFDLVDRIEFTPRISPDGSQIALRDTATREYNLYSVYSVAVDTPFGIEPIESEFDNLIDIAFRGKSVYGITFPKDGAVSLLRVNPTPGPDGIIHTLMSSMNQRLIP